MRDHEVEVARQREQDIIGGSPSKQEYPLQSFKENKALRQTDAHIKPGEDQGVPAPSQNWRSATRGTFNPDVHNRHQVEKMGNSQSGPGKLGGAARLAKSQSETLA